MVSDERIHDDERPDAVRAGGPSAAADPRHRRDGLRRRPARPASARPRAPRALPGARPVPPRRAARGWTRSRSPPATCCGPRRSAAALQGVEPPTTSCTAWRGAPASTSATSRRRGPSAAPPPRPASRASSTSAAWATPPATCRTTCARARRPAPRCAEAGVPVTEFRAAVVVGSGSISFEMIRHLTERLPAMVCPKWVYTRVQPIAVDDLLSYLIGGARRAESAGRVIEIGGADVQTYGGMMLGYAQVRGLRRRLIPVPVLTPRLSSYWVHLVTPIPSTIARPLIEGLRSETVVRDLDRPRALPGHRAGRLPDRRRGRPSTRSRPVRSRPCWSRRSRDVVRRRAAGDARRPARA